MIVGNWMQVNPVTVGSDTLVSEARRLITEHNLHGLPVVDDGRLRGLVTRANCHRLGHFVTRTQNPAELDYFATRLKVKDIMVRRPATVEISDTMEHCLLKGQELGVAQFPVMDGGRVVGMISANEIFNLAAHFLGAWEKRSGLTLAAVKLGPGVLGRIADIAEAAGAVLQAIYPVGRGNGAAEHGYADKRVIIRFHAPSVGAVAQSLQAAGFQVVESVEVPHPPHH